MIGVLLTSTCFYENIDEETFLIKEDIDKETFKIRVEELVQNITTLPDHIKSPYELIIADNSPVDRLPTEQILTFCPENTLLIRYTKNPGKQVGEAAMIRDGVHLSFSRGHRWLLKLTGRYHLIGDWVLDDALSLLEEKRKSIYIHMLGNPMNQMPWAKGHPLYNQYLDSDKLLIGAGTSVFVADPRRLVESGALDHEYLRRRWPNVNLEQLFWHAIKDLDVLHWAAPPIDGWVGNWYTRKSFQGLLKATANPVFDTVASYRELPYIDISPLLDVNEHGEADR